MHKRRRRSELPKVDRPNPWPELVDAANRQVDAINQGDILAARGALRMAAVGIRAMLAGDKPDPERCVYLKFLLKALEQIDKNVSPEKALGLWASNRPRRVPEFRDLSLFMMVGIELDRLAERRVPATASSAIDTVAKNKRIKSSGINKPTIEKAWKGYGGKRAWESARSDAYDPANSSNARSPRHWRTIGWAMTLSGHN